MTSTPQKIKPKGNTDNSGAERSLHRAKKRALDQDSTPDDTHLIRSSGDTTAQAPEGTMSKSSSPAAGSHLTKSGRISKAAKGLPVHHCHCGKTYTRAEHLRRHQQNHKPGAFPCDVEGCERAFAREDLLVRHKAKHNEALEPSEMSRPFTTEVTPELFGAVASSSYSDTSLVQRVPEPSTTDSRGLLPTSSASDRKGYIPITELQPLHMSFPTGGSNDVWDQRPRWEPNLPAYHNYEHQFQAAESMFRGDGQPLLNFETDQIWMAGTSNARAFHSPVPALPSAPAVAWRIPSPASIQLHTPASDISLCNSGHISDLSRGPSFEGIPSLETAMQPEYRDMLEQDELVTPTSAPQHVGTRQYHHRDDNEQRYIDAFWRLIHPAWPIVHKPTFDMFYTSPLLRSSMLALGACSTGNQIDSANACIMHKRCMKVIQKRTINTWHTYRPCDLQAILLVELFSTYKARRPPLQSSKPFQDSYFALTSGSHDDTANALLATVGSFELSAEQLSAVAFELEIRQRLLAAYYILDREQAMFFGRSTADVPNFSATHFKLLRIEHSQADDPAPGYTVYDSIHDEQYETARSSSFFDTPADETRGLFNNLLALTYSNDSNKDASLALRGPPPDLGLHPPLMTSPHLKLARQTQALCKTTPVRALLATAGESWVMGEKLVSHTDYKAAQEAVRHWTSTSATKAFAHALGIVRLHSLHTKTTCLYHEWSLHLASLVIWACTYARRSSDRPLRSPISSSTSAEPVVHAHELDKALADLTQAGESDSVEWEDAKCVLSWTKARLDKAGITRFCGIVAGAVDVLKALVARGDENDWF